MGTYLTVPEYRSAPTANPGTNLVYDAPGANAQGAELLRVITRASSLMSSYLNQDLVASVRTRTHRIRTNRRGEIMLHPGDWPLVSVSSLSVGYQANSLTSISSTQLAAGWVDEDAEAFILPAVWGFTGSTVVQMGAGRPSTRMLAVYSYVAGYPSTTLAATATAGATSVTVSSSTGIVAGTQLAIVDGERTETVTVTATPTTNTVAVSALASAHAVVDTTLNAIAVHAMPDDLRQICILITTALIMTRGNDAMVMGQLVSPSATPGLDPVASANLRLAKTMLDDGGYARVR